ncbi:hypothetical protein LJ207_00760 [Halanaerobium sp. Z-7514]|uniref:Uncharacterized protein n=1 Tax=Halanaerobium polyolivorans TaxID=2886943 RepID=A0AAW4WYD1_9FIRM|nr:hypothetical protein [Halanaerobium polyolivorans]MCC3143857.1 hypothetical protein [Halanaerobium polyolivorans]RQD77775.1 MAG: hypothetical protein D5S01_02285 [Halanaerobium sp. MSAO_Bac5]
MELLANLGALMVAVGLVALLKGDLVSLRIRNRKVALIVLIIGLLLAFFAVNNMNQDNEILNSNYSYNYYLDIDLLQNKVI